MLANPLQELWPLRVERGTTLEFSDRGGELYMVKIVRCDPDDPFPRARVRGEALL
jgi:hypothetical protein